MAGKGVTDPGLCGMLGRGRVEPRPRSTLQPSRWALPAGFPGGEPHPHRQLLLPPWAAPLQPAPHQSHQQATGPVTSPGLWERRCCREAVGGGQPGLGPAPAPGQALVIPLQCRLRPSVLGRRDERLCVGVWETHIHRGRSGAAPGPVRRPCLYMLKLG